MSIGSYALRRRGPQRRPRWTRLAVEALAFGGLTYAIWLMGGNGVTMLGAGVGVGLSQAIRFWRGRGIREMGTSWTDKLHARAADGYVDVPIPIRVVERDGRPVVELVGGVDDGTILEPGSVYQVVLQLANRRTGIGFAQVPAEIRAIPYAPYVDIQIGTAVGAGDLIGLVTPEGDVLPLGGLEHADG